jgi:hypothetical protein
MMSNLEVIRDYLKPNGVPGVDYVVLHDDTVVKGPSMDEIDAARDAAKRAARRRLKLGKRIEEASIAKAAGYAIEGGPTLPFDEGTLAWLQRFEALAAKRKKNGQPLDKPILLPDGSGTITMQQALDHVDRYEAAAWKVYLDWSEAMIADAVDDAKEEK